MPNSTVTDLPLCKSMPSLEANSVEAASKSSSSNGEEEGVTGKPVVDCSKIWINNFKKICF